MERSAVEDHTGAFGTAPCRAAVARRFGPDALVVEAGAPATCVYLIRRGSVRLFRLRENGHETTTGLLGPGQLVGLAALLGCPTHESFAESLTPLDVWALPPRALLTCLSTDAPLAAAVVEGLSRRVALTRALARGIVLLPVGERILDATEWVRSCVTGEAPHLNREALAALTATCPETISRAHSAGLAA